MDAPSAEITPSRLIRTQLKHPGVSEPNPSTETSRQLEQIDSQITERYIKGKFAGKITMHDQEMAPEGFTYPDYITLPSNPKPDLDSTGQFIAITGLMRAGFRPNMASPLEKQLGQCHVIAFRKDTDDPTQSIVQMTYPYEFFDSVGRPALNMSVVLKMPTQAMSELTKLVDTQGGDTIEEFYQIVASGLDDSIKRYTANQVAIIDLDTFMPPEKFSDPTTRLSQMVSAYQSRLDKSGLKILPYTHPMGVVNKEEQEAQRKAEQEIKSQVTEEAPVIVPTDAELPTVSEVQEEPEDIDNPSGLNPNAPLTKLINMVMKPFVKKKA